MRTALLSLLLVGCTTARGTGYIAGNDLVLASKDGLGPLEHDDRIALRNNDGRDTGWVRAGRLRLTSGWVCEVTDQALADAILAVRIAELDDTTLPGVLLGLPERVEVSTDAERRVVFSLGPSDLVRWTRSRHHIEPPGQRARYHFEIRDRGWIGPLTWRQAQDLFHRDRKLLAGWPVDQIGQVDALRGNPRVAAAIAAIPLALTVAIVGGSMRALQQRGERRDRSRRASTSLRGLRDPDARSSDWDAVVCDPYAHYTELRAK